MVETKKIPKRDPDFYHPLTAGYRMNGWQEGDCFVLQYPDKKAELILAEEGIYKKLSEIEKKEIHYTLFKAVLDYIYKKTRIK